MGIGPSTKETTLHHFRDPLLDIAGDDRDIDLLGIMFVGTPDGNEEKYLVGKRAAVWAEGMRAEGVILSSDGWGNSHVDFANTVEELGKRGIPVVGITFNGTAGKFVVTNRYMDTMVDISKNPLGIESEIVGENTTNILDAKKALALLKLKLRRK